MFIIYLEKLNAFAKKYSNARKSLHTWITISEKAGWKTKQDVLWSFPKAK